MVKRKQALPLSGTAFATWLSQTKLVSVMQKERDARKRVCRGSEVMPGVPQELQCAADLPPALRLSLSVGPKLRW